MNKKYLFFILSCGIICGMWTYIAGLESTIYPQYFSIWLGFVGITSFFIAENKRNYSILSNLVGILIGSSILYLTNLYPNNLLMSIYTGVFTSFICYLGKYKFTKYVPCIFLGGFSTFAKQDNLSVVIYSIILGNLFGELCVICSDILYKISNKYTK